VLILLFESVLILVFLVCECVCDVKNFSEHKIINNLALNFLFLCFYVSMFLIYIL